MGKDFPGGGNSMGKCLMWDPVFPHPPWSCSSLLLSLPLSGSPPQTLPEAVPRLEQHHPPPRGREPQSARVLPPHPSLSCPTGGPGVQPRLQLQEPPGPAQWADPREAENGAQQPSSPAEQRAAPEGERQGQRPSRGQPRCGLRGRQDALEVLLARRECQDNPGEAGKSIQTAGEPAPAPQVSMLCPGDGFSQRTVQFLAAPWLSEQACEVGKVIVVTVGGKSAWSSHTREASGEVSWVSLNSYKVNKVLAGGPRLSLQQHGQADAMWETFPVGGWGYGGESAPTRLLWGHFFFLPYPYSFSLMIPTLIFEC